MMFRSTLLYVGLWQAAAEDHNTSVESILPTKMPQPPTGDDDYHGHDLLNPLQMLYHLYHQGMGGVHHEVTDLMSGALGDVGDITDIMLGDFFDTRKTAKFGIYSSDFNLDEYGSVATDVTVYAKTKEYNVNKDDFRYLSVDVHGGSFGHWFGYNPTVKMFNGVGNVYISAYYFRPLPVEPYMAGGNHSMDEATTTTPRPEQYDHGHDEDYRHVTLTAKARANIYLPWGQTAVPCFGSAGGDGAWYLMHQFGDERLHCVVFDGKYKTWYYADHPERRDPVRVTSGDVLLAMRKHSGYMRGYRVKPLAHGLPFILQWRGVQRGMQSTTAKIERGCGGFCVFGDYGPMYTVDDTYRVDDSTIELSFDHSVLTATTPYPHSDTTKPDTPKTEGPIQPTTTEGPMMESTTTEGPMMESTTTEGPMMESTTTEGPMMESTTTEGPMMESTTESAVVTSPPAGDTTVTPILP
ncbi:hypothetical protein FOL46_007501 [Perkinsus olseni]|uniref:Dual specificity protein kinase yak1 n=1 Tax=Perkinsus olseni TaxID=32597 RepID=A0A7J6LDG9_PEROL|nr:hypothetical protein FOL46_007501 [Perkinsus olseni]